MEALEKKMKELEDIIKQMIAAAKMAIPTIAQTHDVNTPRVFFDGHRSNDPRDYADDGANP